jgi:electron transport complex protein RnfD
MRTFTPRTAPHAPVHPNVALTMRRVIYALVPAACVETWFFGYGFAINVVIAATTAVAAEWIVFRLQGRAATSSIGDSSAIVTAFLLAFAIPPLVPAWLPALAALGAVLIGKHLYGGLGKNLFNPAMVGYVIVLVSFPVEMTQWIPPRIGDLDYVHLGFIEQLMFSFGGLLPADLTLDALTRATPLDVVKSGLHGMQTFAETRTGALFGDFGGRGWEWIANATAVGGLYLLYTGTIRWHIPVAMLAGLLVPATIFHALDTSRYASPGFHLFSGATVLGAFFIATDPVTAAATARGRLLFGTGIGLLTFAIRVWGGYPDGVAFAVLLMNAAVPLIDRYTRPRIYGH